MEFYFSGNSGRFVKIEGGTRGWKRKLRGADGEHEDVMMIHGDRVGPGLE